MSEHKYADVQASLRRLHKTHSWAFMSAECGISAQTIKKFACSQTPRPQFRTVDVLADYAGFRLSIFDLRINEPLHLRRVK